MNNPFQDQLIKAGLVSKQQIHKAKQNKSKKNKQQHFKKENVVDEVKLKAQQTAEKKAERDRELNKKKEEMARQKATSIEINQLVSSNCLMRDEGCNIAYNFEHNKKVRRIYVNDEMKQKIIQGKLGIARIEGRYEVVPQVIAEKIQQRNKKRIVIFEAEQLTMEENDPYSEYQVPDDLTW